MLPTFFKQILRVRSGGFTIMEVMVAAGLTGIASLAVIQLFGQTSKLQQESQVRSEMMQLRLLVKTILSDRGNCEATIVPNNVGPIVKTTPGTVISEGSYINLPNGIRRYSPSGDKSAIAPGSKFGGRLDILSVELMHYTPRTSSKVDSANNRILDTGILEVKVSVNRKVYRASAGGGQVLGDSTVSIVTPVMVSLDNSNNVTGCIFNSNLTSQRITDETCEKFVHRGNGVGLAGTISSDVCSIAPTVTGQTRIQAHREMVIKEELCRSLKGALDSNGRCQHPWANFYCPSGYVISGFPEEGSRNFHCTQIPTIPSCAGNLVPVITGVTTDNAKNQSRLTYSCVVRPPP